MYSTGLLQAVAFHVDASFITARRPNGWYVRDEQLYPTFEPIPDCFQVGQIGVIQGERPGSFATVNLARYQYTGNDQWVPMSSNCLSAICMLWRSMGAEFEAIN